MLLVIVFCVAFRLTTAFVRAPLVSNYNVEREKLMAQEQHISIGGQIVLTPDERKVDNYLRKLKKLEVCSFGISKLSSTLTHLRTD